MAEYKVLMSTLDGSLVIMSGLHDSMEEATGELHDDMCAETDLGTLPDHGVRLKALFYRDDKVVGMYLGAENGEGDRFWGMVLKMDEKYGEGGA